MTRVKNTALTFIVAVMMVAAMAFTAAPAKAASAAIAIHNQGDSGAWLDVIMYVPASGASYETNLYPGDTIGEPAYNQSNAEPLSYYNRASWCSKWWYETLTEDGWVNGPITYRGGPVASGVWVDVYPGSATTLRRIVHVKTWNC